jgi:hypothetical protein
MIFVMNFILFVFFYPYLISLFIIEFELFHSLFDLLLMVKIDLYRKSLNIIVNALLILRVDEVNYVS